MPQPVEQAWLQASFLDHSSLRDLGRPKAGKSTCASCSPIQLLSGGVVVDADPDFADDFHRQDFHFDSWLRINIRQLPLPQK